VNTLLNVATESPFALVVMRFSRSVTDVPPLSVVDV